MALHQDLLANDKVAPDMMRSWYLTFQQVSATWSLPVYCAATGCVLDSDGRLTDSAVFYTALKAFLDVEVVMVPGLPAIKVHMGWASDVIWIDEADPTKGLSAARFGAGHPVAATQDTPQRIACLEEMEKVAAASSLEVAIWSAYYMFFDQFRTIYGELMVNFAMCLAAISVICLLALHHLNVVALVCVLITMVPTPGYMTRIAQFAPDLGLLFLSIFPRVGRHRPDRVRLLVGSRG